MGEVALPAEQVQRFYRVGVLGLRALQDLWLGGEAPVRAVLDGLADPWSLSPTPPGGGYVDAIDLAMPVTLAGRGRDAVGHGHAG